MLALGKNKYQEYLATQWLDQGQVQRPVLLNIFFNDLKKGIHTEIPKVNSNQLQKDLECKKVVVKFKADAKLCKNSLKHISTMMNFNLTGKIS